MNTGWTGKVMVFLTYGTQIIILNFLWILGTLAGGIILGIGPATRSLGRLSTALILGAPADSLWREFWGDWKRHFWATNKKGWPFLAALLFISADLLALEILSHAGQSNAGMLIGPLVIVGSACAVAYAFFHASLLRFEGTTWKTVRFSLLTPVAFLPTAFAIVLVTVAFVALTWNWPLVAVLCGFSVPLGFSVAIAGRALDSAYPQGFIESDSLLVEAAHDSKVRDQRRAEENERMKRMKM